MTRPIFGTDPLDGINFTFGQRLRSAQHMNYLLPWMRNLDIALETISATNWLPPTDPGAIDLRGACYCPGLGMWAAVGSNGGDPKAAACSALAGSSWSIAAPAHPGGATDLTCVCSNGVDTFVAGSDTGHMFSSTDGVTWTERACSATAIGSVHWDSTHSKFIATASARAWAHSANGIAWTAIADGAANDLPDGMIGHTTTGACHGNGYSVLVATAADIVCVSTDGLTWASHPSSGVDYNNVCYADKLSTFFASCSTGVASSIDNGTTWNDVVGVPVASRGPIASSGNLLVAGDSIGNLVLSDDGGATWSVIGQNAGADVIRDIQFQRGASGTGGRFVACNVGYVDMSAAVLLP